MNDTARPPRDEAPAPPPGLSSAERAELQRQGAKSAARGELPDRNPLHERRNQPPATGESAESWSQRSDAWDQGHEAQSATRREADPAAPPRDADEHD